MSLLTDEDRQRLGEECETGGEFFLKVSEAQHTKTLKAVAEWLLKPCEAPHGPFGHHYLCFCCMLEAAQGFCEGKMPGEE